MGGTMIEPGIYQRSGTSIEAMQYVPASAHAVAHWSGGVQIPTLQAAIDFSTPRMLHIFNPSGVSVARYGDYVVKDPFGKFYACSQHIFEATYEEMSV